MGIFKNIFKPKKETTPPTTGPIEDKDNLSMGAVVQSALGLMHVEGIGVAKDLAKAFEFLQKAASQGDAPAQYNLRNLGDVVSYVN